MTRATIALGQLGERLAAEHLDGLGYTLVTRNWRASVDGLRGELDIVARDGATLVFCEVKARRGAVADDRALAAVGAAKRRQLRRLAGLYLAREGRHAGPVRFDVVGIGWPAAGGAPRLVHVREAF